MKIKKWEIALFAAILISVFVGSLSLRQTELSENLIRLHVVANSNSEEDQSLKLSVRDAVLEKLDEILEGCKDKEQAEALILSNIDTLTQAASEVISEKGGEFSVNTSLTREVFPRVSYENYTLPAGKYSSLRVVIGEGEGDNWWCVIFPPLCFTIAEDTISYEELGLSDETLRIISEDSEGYVVKLKLLEWISDIKLWLGG
ncbi:MAG TPA: stage II sporulation protein R [Clostridiales bacterium]|jgi:stage II sporulation protein R|nr:stage II sporulation protein R [Clostridiales bacterium]